MRIMNDSNKKVKSTVDIPRAKIWKIILLMYFIPVWHLEWVFYKTGYLNIDGFVERTPKKEVLKCLFIPFYSVSWIKNTTKRIGKLCRECNIPCHITGICVALQIVASIFYFLVSLTAFTLLLCSLAAWCVYVFLSITQGDAFEGFVGLPTTDAQLEFTTVMLTCLIVLVQLVFIFLITKVHYIIMQVKINRLSFVLHESERENERLRVQRIQMENDLPVDPNAILEIRNLRKTFPLKSTSSDDVKRELVAVDDVSFKLYPGETLGIVGESGCGKTTLGRTILHLYEPTGGQVFYKGLDISKLSSFEMRCLRTDMQIIFQDPYSSLPPRSTVGDILSEPVTVHHIVPPRETKAYILNLMDQCGLRDYYYERYPHEFSGGQRQRICIARALSVDPQLVVCDEPVSALDVSIQAQIINLLKKLQKERNLTYLFISHDLSVVKFISDKIGVMYLGSMVEFGRKEDIFSNPMHPYTRALLSAIPNPDPDKKMERIVLKGDIPSPANPPKGCRFHTRCPHACEKCSQVAPVYREYEPGHFVACHLLEQDEAAAEDAPATVEE